MSKPKIRLTIFRCTLTQGGADRVAVTLLKSLPRDRYELTLLLMRHEGELLDEVPADVRIESIGSDSLWTLLPGMVRYFRERKPEVLLSLDGGGNAPILMARRLARSNCFTIVSERNILWNGGFSLRRALLVGMKRLTYWNADVVASVSSDLADEMKGTLALDPARVVTVYNPVVTDDLLQMHKEPLDHPWFQEQTPVVLAVGRLVGQKDYPLLLAAFAKVRSRKQARLVVLGGGPLAAELEAAAAASPYAKDIAFLGFQRNPYKFMAHAAVYVLSSRNEGLPGTLIQAMACGAPSVSTDCPTGPREIIQDGVNGRLVAVGDAEGLASAISAMLDDPEAARRMADAGRQSVEKFRAADVVRHYENLWDAASPRLA